MNGRHQLLEPEFLARLERLSLTGRRIYSGRRLAGRRSRRMGGGLEFVDHRHYSPGDDPRLVDWLLFGRTRRLYCRLYRQERDRDVAVLLDCSRSMAAEPGKFSYARSLAAALVALALLDDDRVWLQAFADRPLAELRSRSGRAALLPALRFLAGLHCRGGTDLAGAARHLVETLGRRRALVLLISDFMQEPDPRPGLDWLVGHGLEVMALHVHTPGERRPRRLGPWRLVDPEGRLPPQQLLLTRTLNERYRKQFDAFSASLQAQLHARGGHYLLVSTAVPVEQLVLGQMRAGHLVV